MTEKRIKQIKQSDFSEEVAALQKQLKKKIGKIIRQEKLDGIYSFVLDKHDNVMIAPIFPEFTGEKVSIHFLRKMIFIAEAMESEAKVLKSKIEKSLKNGEKRKLNS